MGIVDVACAVTETPLAPPVDVVVQASLLTPGGSGSLIVTPVALPRPQLVTVTV